MPIRLITFVLLALAALVVVLTRVRMRREGAAGAHQVPRGVVNVHTGFGALGLLAWLAYLLVGDRASLPVSGEVIGITAIFCLWIVAIAGLLILMRWLPSRGRHALEAAEDDWSGGPGLSILAHLGMVGGVVFFTAVYMLDKV